MENQMINLKCRKCGATVSAEQKKCPKCGAPVLLKIMMEEEKRHLPAKEIREKDKRMRREYEKLNKEKEEKRQKAERKQKLSEEKKERARIKQNEELAAIRKKEEAKAAKAEQKNAAKEEKIALAAKKREEKLAKKEAGFNKKFPVWVIFLIAALIIIAAVSAVLLLNRSDTIEPVTAPDIDAPIVTEEIVEEQPEEIEEVPVIEEQVQETQPAPKEQPAENKPARNITRNNYLFPSDTQYLTESDVAGLSKFDTGLIRNEIYARKGYVFKDDPYKSYFNSQAWYNPNPSAKITLNETEKYNVNFLLEYERSQGWR